MTRPDLDRAGLIACALMTIGALGLLGLNCALTILANQGVFP